MTSGTEVFCLRIPAQLCISVYYLYISWLLSALMTVTCGRTNTCRHTHTYLQQSKPTKRNRKRLEKNIELLKNSGTTKYVCVRVRVSTKSRKKPSDC